MYMIYLKYWTLNLMPPMVTLKYYSSQTLASKLALGQGLFSLGLLNAWRASTDKIFHKSELAHPLC